MKKHISILCILLFSLTALQPASSLICVFFGYEFTLASYEIYSVIMLIAAVTIFIMSMKSSEPGKAVNILLIILPLISFINAVCFLIKSESLFVYVCMLIYFILCCILSLKLSSSIVLKYIVVAVSCLMLGPVVLLASLYFIIGPFTESTTIMTLSSPDGSYYAEVQDFDQGALGGDTLVYIHEKALIDVIIFRVEKTPQRIYTGEWGEYKDMNIYWKSDNCLVINSKRYFIE